MRAGPACERNRPGNSRKSEDGAMFSILYQQTWGLRAGQESRHRRYANPQVVLLLVPVVDRGRQHHMNSHGILSLHLLPS